MHTIKCEYYINYLHRYLLSNKWIKWCENKLWKVTTEYLEDSIVSFNSLVTRILHDKKVLTETWIELKLYSLIPIHSYIINVIYLSFFFNILSLTAW